MVFTGEKCVLCGEVFTENDDVVVCPQCGSPHHRECYKKDNKCANEALHAEGFRWNSARASEPEEETKICPMCGYKNGKYAVNCARCGVSLADEAADDELYEEGEDSPFGIPRPYLGFDPEEDMGGAPLKDVSDFVRTNTIYYIPIFKRMKDTGRSISFNLISFIFPPIYFANRKMWFWAIVSLILSVLLSMPFAVSFFLIDGIENGNSVFPDEVSSMLFSHRNFLTALIEVCNAADLLMRIVFCLYANKLYYKFVLRTLRRIRTRGGTQMSSEEIAAAGGIRPLNVLLIAVISVAAMFVSTYASFIFIEVIANNFF